MCSAAYREFKYQSQYQNSCWLLKSCNKGSVFPGLGCLPSVFLSSLTLLISIQKRSMCLPPWHKRHPAGETYAYSLKESNPVERKHEVKSLMYNDSTGTRTLNTNRLHQDLRNLKIFGSSLCLITLLPTCWQRRVKSDRKWANLPFSRLWN